MNIKLNKKDLDEAIRLEKKYWQTGDPDLLPAVTRAEKKAVHTDDYLPRGAFIDIISGITQIRPFPANETYYKIFEILGYEIVNEQEEEK